MAEKLAKKIEGIKYEKTNFPDFYSEWVKFDGAPEGANETYLGYYTGNNNPKNPYASPLFGDLTGLPPIIIQVGNNETLRDDSVMFADKAKRSGVEVKINVWDGMFHCFPLMAPMFEEATKAMNETCKFLNNRL